MGFFILDLRQDSYNKNTMSIIFSFVLVLTTSEWRKRKTKNSTLTWKRRPSGEKVFTPRSYSDLVKYILFFLYYWFI